MSRNSVSESTDEIGCHLWSSCNQEMLQAFSLVTDFYKLFFLITFLHCVPDLLLPGLPALLFICRLISAEHPSVYAVFTVLFPNWSPLSAETRRMFTNKTQLAYGCQTSQAHHRGQGCIFADGEKPAVFIWASPWAVPMRGEGLESWKHVTYFREPSQVPFQSLTSRQALPSDRELGCRVDGPQSELLMDSRSDRWHL